MEKTGIEIEKRSWQKMIPDIKWAVRYDIYILPTIFFLISTLYFCLFGSHVLFYQENFSLFVFSDEYLQQFIVKPGGLLEYAGNFLTQSYFHYIIGAIIVSLILTLLVIVFLQINKRLSPGVSYSLVLIFVPSCVLLLMHSSFIYLMYNNLGFILATLYFLLSIMSDKKHIHIVVLVFFPVFYYLVGAYAWIFLGMYIFYNLVFGRVIYPVFLLVITFGTFILFRDVLFLQTSDALLRYPLPLVKFYTHIIFFYLVCGLFILFPLLIKISGLIKIKTEKARTISFSMVVIVFIITLISLSILYKPEDANLFKIEKMVTRQDWEGVVKRQENYPSSNIIVQYYYNLALSEKGQLCERMFFGRQDFGTRALIIPWDSQKGINNIFRGVYFYYAIGLINEAHRWAFESMVDQGYRPENIKLLIKTDLINGHYKVAEKYIYVLKKTLNYRKLAIKFEKMLNNPALVNSDPELGEKIRLQPKEDFPIKIKNPQTNLPALLKSNPDNKKAFEYKMAWYLLGKNVGGIIQDIRTWKEIGYKQMPKHIEEAALIYYANSGLVSGISGLKMSDETGFRFLKYESSTKPFGGNKLPDPKEVQKMVGNTYWYYLEFR